MLLFERSWNLMFKLRALTPLCVLLTLSACGGGGGGDSSKDLYVSVSYPSDAVSLFSTTNLQPALNGFDGHRQRCVQTSGALPAGLQLNDDCSISGRPTQTGSFNVAIKVSADDADGSVNVATAVIVSGPTLRYPTRLNSLSLADAVTDVAQIGTDGLGWHAPTDGTPLTWLFTLSAGALPPALVLNPATGTISGVLSTSGSYTATVQALLKTPYGNFTPEPASYRLAVGTAQTSFSYSQNGSIVNGYADGYIGVPFSTQPAIPSLGSLSNFSIGNAQLSGGLIFDPISGSVTGIPTTQGDTPASYPVTATLTIVGVGHAVNSLLGISINNPITLSYITTFAKIGTPIRIAPQLSFATPLSGAVQNFTINPGLCFLPTSLSVDPLTGSVNGTPATAGTYGCEIVLKNTYNGVTWPTRAYVSIQVDS